MLESGKRKPSLEVLEKVAAALGIPFHLFTLLASEPTDIRGADPNSVRKLALALSRLLLTGGDRESDRNRTRTEVGHSKPKVPRRRT
jgi:transcriptional regulator with XRE-family HTH domain